MFLDKVFVFEVVKKGNVIILKDRVIIVVLLKFIRDFMRNCSGNFLQLFVYKGIFIMVGNEKNFIIKFNFSFNKIVIDV